LEDDGYDVTEHASAETALQYVESTPVDLMLVDLMLGGMDGFTFIQRVRPMSGAPIVVISARDGTRDIVAALEVGADDYVTKPFVVDEIKARLRAMLRRPAIAGAEGAEGAEDDAQVIDSEAGPLSFDISAGMLRRGGEEVHLTSTEFHLLRVLTENAGKVLSRQTLLDRVWDQGFFGDERIVDVHVRRLRTKVERDPGAPSLIVTVRGLGYRLDPR
jgi:DNA-binding response OmpR family regulator